MALSARPNPFLDALEAEHRAWLGGFHGQYLRNWEKLLNNNEEDAMTEASVRRLLEQRGVTVSPNEDLTGNQQRPDFRCEVPDGQFYVEVTCISVEKATEITGLVDGANIALRPTPLTTKIQSICKKKAVQSGNHDAPVLIAIGTFHGIACMFSFSPPYLDMLLTGTSMMSIQINRLTLERVGVEIEADPSSAAFLRYDADERIGFARSSISGLLLCGVSLEPIWVQGVLHPNPARPFNPRLIPDIGFGEVEVDRESGQLRTRWPGEGTA